IPWTAAHEKLLTAHVGRSTPDVSQLGNTWVPEFAAIGALESLDSRIAGSTELDSSAFFAGIWRTNIVNDTVFGIPWYVDTRVVFYRTDLLADAGYDRPPGSWDEWLEAMRAVKRQVGPDRYAIFLPTNEWMQPVVLGQQAGSPILRDGGRYGAFSEPEFRRAFEFYVSLFEEDLAPRIGNTQMSNVYQEFARGTFAMYITGPWNIGEFRRRLPPEMEGRWATAPLPGPTGPESGTSNAGGSSVVLFRHSPHKAEAWRLIEFLSRPEQQRRFFELTGSLPAREATWEHPTLIGDEYARAFWEQLQRVEPLPKVPEIELIVTKVFERAETVIRGGVSVERALAELDREVDAILEKRRWMLERAEGRGTRDEVVSSAARVRE
ncbi:MAG TPA: sugar ABC transporter substrate-binding protein, partial [Gemmatimonadaceae bacterium]|nr:sugar ABC transporter substrate-binding protein [Gemmatimonadaceae bacterium]